MYKIKYFTCNACPRQQLVCINEVIYVASPARNPAGLNLKTYPEDQVIEESKYKFLQYFFLNLFSDKNGRYINVHVKG